MTLTRLGRATGLALAVALLATLAAGCGLVPTRTASEESAVDSYYGEPVVEGEAAAPADAASTEGSAKSDAATVPEADRLIIRTKTLRLEVESTSDTVDEIRTLTKEHSGVITNLQVATDTDEWLYRYDDLRDVHRCRLRTRHRQVPVRGRRRRDPGARGHVSSTREPACRRGAAARVL